MLQDFATNPTLVYLNNDSQSSVESLISLSDSLPRKTAILGKSFIPNLKMPMRVDSQSDPKKSIEQQSWIGAEYSLTSERELVMKGVGKFRSNDQLRRNRDLKNEAKHRLNNINYQLNIVKKMALLKERNFLSQERTLTRDPSQPRVPLSYALKKEATK